MERSPLSPPFQGGKICCLLTPLNWVLKFTALRGILPSLGGWRRELESERKFFSCSSPIPTRESEVGVGFPILVCPSLSAMRLIPGIIITVCRTCHYGRTERPRSIQGSCGIANVHYAFQCVLCIFVYRYLTIFDVTYSSRKTVNKV